MPHTIAGICLGRLRVLSYRYQDVWVAIDISSLRVRRCKTARPNLFSCVRSREFNEIEK
jgi:hypothetical protein